MGDRLRRTNHLSISPRRPHQLSLLRSAGRETSNSQKCGDVLRLGSKGRYGTFHLLINVSVAGKNVWSLVNTCHTWAPYRWVMIKSYTNLRLLLLYSYPSLWLKAFPHLKFPEDAWDSVKGTRFTTQKVFKIQRVSLYAVIFFRTEMRFRWQLIVFDSCEVESDTRNGILKFLLFYMTGRQLKVQFPNSNFSIYPL